MGAMSWNVDKLKNDVVPLIYSCGYNLQSVYDTLGSIAIPGDFEYADTINNVKEHVGTIITGVSSIRQWVVTKAHALEEMEKSNIELINMGLLPEKDSEQVTEIPYYNQLEYGNTRYGNSTVQKSGCGITSLAMVLSYLKDSKITPDELAALYHKYKVEGGSSYGLFMNTQEEWGVSVENCYWEDAWGKGKLMEALKNGQPVIMNVHSDSVFTNGGHFIVLAGLTEDGKIIVKDPNGANLMSQNSILKDGFENGFDPEYFKRISGNYFIYNKKGDTTAGTRDDDTIKYQDNSETEKQKLLKDLINQVEQDKQKNESKNTGIDNNITLDGTIINPKWDSGYLRAPLGYICYTGEDGRYTKETFCPDNTSKLIENMKKRGIDLKFWVREDGVCMYGDYVMVAADVPYTENDLGAEYRFGDIVETSLGTGMVIDYCEEAHEAGKGFRNDKNNQNKKIDVWYDIYTQWHDGGEYQKKEYHTELEWDNYTKYNEGVTKATIETPTQPAEIESNKEASPSIVNTQPKNNTDIAHRGYKQSGGIGNNLAEDFRLAGESGFWGTEADVRFDANGNLVCSHNAVKNGQNPTSFEEYLDICKEYGMTAIIDLKYETGSAPADQNLSPAVLKTIEEKGMMDNCILQTWDSKDIAKIRENSEDARIWYLTDNTSDENINLIKENNVECVNTQTSENNANKIKKLTDNGIDVCVWNVQSETSKERVLNMGAKYVMSDNVLGSTPYQEDEEDINAVKSEP